MPSVSSTPIPEVTGPVSVYAAGTSVQGTGREQNEDCYVVDPDGRFFVVADGIGGSGGGDLASRMACDILNEELDELLRDSESSATSQFVFLLDQKEQIRIQLLTAMKTANSAILSERQCNWRHSEMGTTAIAAVVIDEDLYVANIGDSRACRVRDGVIERLTSDHTMTAGLVDAGLLSPEEAATHQYRNVLYKYLGAWSENDPADVESFRIQSGDCLVLATDGLTDCVAEEEIAAICQQFSDPESIAIELVNHAIENSSTDDVTCIVAHFA